MSNSEIAALAFELKTTLDRVAAAVANNQIPEPEDFVVLRGSTESFIEAAQNGNIASQLTDNAFPVLSMFRLADVRPSEASIDRNLSKVGDGEPCAVCGKRVNPDNAKWIHISEYDKLYPTDIGCEEAESLPEGSMYMFPVGPECAKKIPPEYLHTTR